jgi:hypothetical protein
MISHILLKDLNIKEVEFSSLYCNRVNYFEQFKKKMLGGLIIRKMYSQSEVENVIVSLNEIDRSCFDSPHAGASTYPAACSSQKYTENFDKLFFMDTNFFLRDLDSRISLYNTRVNELFDKLSGYKYKVFIAEKDEYNSYLPGTFRFINSDKTSVGLTQIHNGLDYAMRCLNQSYLPIKDRISVLKQFSFFTVIQKPIIGGDFTLFNFNTEKYKSVENGNILISSKGDRVNVYSKAKFFNTLKLEVGDAFIFPDYFLWHRVEPIEGDIERVSYGCWFTIDDQDNKITYWS